MRQKLTPATQSADDTTGSGMVQEVIPGRPQALEDFMRELRELREHAGQPSFRRMARKSGAVSHATLHLSVTGYRLQPWETVREFVRACDGDEAAWHAKWREVDVALSGEELEPEPPSGSRSKRWLAPLAVGVVAAGAVGVALAVTGDDTPPPAGKSPKGQQAAIPGDASRFIADVTVPDGTVVKPGSRFDKIWEIQNSGSVAWTDRYLRRDDTVAGPQPCRTPDRIPVEDVAAGKNVKIKVSVTAPDRGPDTCKVHWKMVDGSGKLMFPGSRPIFFEVKVRG